MPRKGFPIFLSQMSRGRPGVRGFATYPIRALSRRVRLGIALAAVFFLMLMPFCVVMVDQTEAVFVTDFGRPVRLISNPGLHGKWPWQTRLGYDRRLQLDAPPPREILTKDKRVLEVAWYVSWRVSDFERFVKSVRAWPDASARLEDLTASVLSTRLVRLELPELVKVGGVSGVETLMTDVTARVAEQAEKEYGLKVVDVRLRRLNYPQDVKSAVFAQIRSERARVAAATRAEGECQARTIRSASDLERARTLAEADADAARVIGEGEAHAARVGNEAYAADPVFYQFLKTLETYRVGLDDRTTLVLSTDSPFLRLLAQGVPDLAPPRSVAGPLGSTNPPPVAPTGPAADVTPAPGPIKPGAEPLPPPAPVRPPVVPPVTGSVRPPVGTSPAGPGRSSANRPSSGSTAPRPPVSRNRP